MNPAPAATAAGRTMANRPRSAIVTCDQGGTLSTTQLTGAIANTAMKDTAPRASSAQASGVRQARPTQTRPSRRAGSPNHTATVVKYDEPYTTGSPSPNSPGRR